MSAARWIQCEDKDSAEYKRLFVTGWSPWQPYLRLGDPKRPHKNTASLYTKKWLVSNGWKEVPKRFGLYAIGILPPDSPLGVRDAKPDDHQVLERCVLIANHGVVGGAATEANTLNKRLMSYATKVKPYEYAIRPWMMLGFRVFVKWVEIYLDDEESLSSKNGSKIRKDRETDALKQWKFHLNVSEQKSTKGASPVLTQSPFKFVVREEKTGIRTVEHYRSEQFDEKKKMVAAPSGWSKMEADAELLKAGAEHGLEFLWWIGELTERGKRPLTVPVHALGRLYSRRLAPLSLQTEGDRDVVFMALADMMAAEASVKSETAAATASATTASK